MKLSISKIDSEFNERLSEISFRLNDSLDRRTSGPIIPNEEFELNVSKFRRVSELEALAYASWYLGDLGILLRLQIEELSLFKAPEAIKLRLITSSRAMMYEVLLSDNSARDFFGNLLGTISSTANRLSFRTIRQQTAKRLIRRRGYRDHGSLRPSEKWLEKNDWSFTETQNEIEELRQSTEDTCQFLLGLMGAI